jgi:2-dehydropantoate 2-reductase
MRVTIVGCGALGSILATRLIAAGTTVQILQRPGRQLDALRRGGVTVIRGTDRATQVPAAVSDDPADLAPTDLAIVLVKTYSTGGVAPLGRLLKPDATVLTLQNGLGAPDRLAEMFGADRVAAGTATYGGYVIEPGLVGAGGEGRIVIGPWTPGVDVSRAAAVLAGSGFNVETVADPREAIWRKLAINAMVNPVSALTRMPNAELLRSEVALGLMRELGRDVVAAAARAGVHFVYDEIWAMHMENLERTAANKASMLQDIEAGRRTEIDAISGGVLGFAVDAAEFPATRAVHALLKAVDENRDATGTGLPAR